MATSANFFTFSNTINGEARDGPRVTQAVNPSNKQPLWKVPVASEADVDEAVAAATQAFTSWSSTSWSERAKLLSQAREALLAIKEEMASIIMQENGKPIQFARMEVDHSVGFLTYHSSHPEIQPKLVQDDEDLRLSIRYVPMGVVAAICPFNYPLVLAMGKIGAALLTGNCVIVKPSPLTPYSVLKFVEVVKSIFPRGVIQALNGDEKTGPLLCEHPGIQKISFTGSIATGKKIMAAASKTLKSITLELGGNDACIVCPDVDVSVVAPQVASGAFLNSGQYCLASKRIYVHEDIYDKFLQRMIDIVKEWKTSPSTADAGNMLGPIQNEMQYKIVKQFYEDCRRKGYKFALGSPDIMDDNNFVIQPAIIDNPPDGAKVVKEEAFGPIVPVLSWKDEDEVIRRVNDTNTGLGASVWSGDVDRATALGERIQSGTVYINKPPRPLPNGYLAGWKESGVGGEWGTEGLLAYCNTQTVHCYKSPVAPGSAEAD
ncbi:hypothetical protein VTN77DRAFT_2089 [Rasamsonia byssochlamydoides]|uniref:uncharacterized protein n=1 Tax=Rasamsonia byssochlamydoides TaxID=89139 RepID=UPI0037442965